MGNFAQQRKFGDAGQDSAVVRPDAAFQFGIRGRFRLGQDTAEQGQTTGAQKFHGQQGVVEHAQFVGGHQNEGSGKRGQGVQQALAFVQRREQTAGALNKGRISGRSAQTGLDGLGQGSGGQGKALAPGGQMRGTGLAQQQGGRDFRFRAGFAVHGAIRGQKAAGCVWRVAGRVAAGRVVGRAAGRVVWRVVGRIVGRVVWRAVGRAVWRIIWRVAGRATGLDRLKDKGRQAGLLGRLCQGGGHHGFARVRVRAHNADAAALRHGRSAPGCAACPGRGQRGCRPR